MVEANNEMPLPFHFISGCTVVGNMIGLKEAIGWILNTCKGYRLPESVRLAHIEAGAISRK